MGVIIQPAIVEGDRAGAVRKGAAFSKRRDDFAKGQNLKVLGEPLQLTLEGLWIHKHAGLNARLLGFGAGQDPVIGQNRGFCAVELGPGPGVSPSPLADEGATYSETASQESFHAAETSPGSRTSPWLGGLGGIGWLGGWAR